MVHAIGGAQTPEWTTKPGYEVIKETPTATTNSSQEYLTAPKPGLNDTVEYQIMDTTAPAPQPGL